MQLEMLKAVIMAYAGQVLAAGQICKNTRVQYLDSCVRDILQTRRRFSQSFAAAASSCITPTMRPQ